MIVLPALAGCRAEPPPSQTVARPSVAAACGHAHNDYLHERPLFDALAFDFCSVEADVWLVEGELRVGHDRAAAARGPTLRTLYLDPLARLVAARGRINDGVDGFTLLVDVKSEADATYGAIDAELQRTPSLFTAWRDGVVVEGPVTVIISGNRARALVEKQSPRWAALDGRWSDLVPCDDAKLTPLVSDDFASGFALSWDGRGSVPSSVRDKLQDAAAWARARNEHLRVFGWPGDDREAWSAQIEAGVDRINADDLAGLASLLGALRGR